MTRMAHILLVGIIVAVGAATSAVAAGPVVGVSTAAKLSSDQPGRGYGKGIDLAQRVAHDRKLLSGLGDARLAGSAMRSAKPLAALGTTTQNGTLAAGDSTYPNGAYFDVHQVTFSGGDLVEISLSSTAFDPFLVVWDPAQGYRADDDSGGNLNSRVLFGVTRAGTWEIYVQAATDGVSTGAYTLTIKVTSATALTSGNTTQTGTLAAGDALLPDGTYADPYVVQFRNGDQVEVRLSSTVFDAYLQITDSEGRVTSDDDSGGGRNSLLAFSVAQGGTWAILANSAIAGTGSYTLNIKVTNSTSAAPPVASFTASASSGTAPLTVQFTNTSTGSDNSYSWNFGDGGTGTTANISHTFTAAGTYTVRLTATNAGGSNSTTRTITVTAPTARLFARVIEGARRVSSPMTVAAGATLRFEVLTFTKADSSDLQLVTNYTWTVPARLGRATALGQMSVATVAGVTDSIVFQRQGTRAVFRLTIGPGAIARISITPANASVALGKQQQFSAQASDRYNNPVPGQTFNWHTVGNIGTIDRSTGMFTAGRTAGRGFIIAATIVNGTVVFGDNGASATGTARIVVGTPLPDQITLHQNTPNPFNPSTEIAFELPVAERVRLTVYNLVGQEIAKVIDETFPAGSHRVRWDASGQSSGAYIYVLEAGAYREQRKMLLLR